MLNMYYNYFKLYFTILQLHTVGKLIPTIVLERFTGDFSTRFFSNKKYNK